MGRAKAAWMEEQEAEALAENLETLLSEGGLDEGTPAHGISKQIIDKGVESLSEKQHTVFETVISGALERMARDHEIERLVNKDD